MIITNLTLKNFRNHTNINLEFSNNKNIIIGNNGIGKSNIIEAIYYLALTKSFRTNNDEVLIKNNEEFAVIEADVVDKISNKYKIIINKTGKNIKIDNKSIKLISDYISKVNIILFTTEDLKLIKDNPSIHRKLINMELSQFNNEYLRLLSLYNKVLKQRNTYLKSMYLNGNIPTDYLDILTDKLIDLGLKIYEIRKQYITEINRYLGNIFKKIVKKENLSIKYISNYENKTKEDLLKNYKKNYQKDINYGKTHLGIHIDDFIFMINDLEAKDFLSEGELKNAIISFKLSEIKYCIEYKNKVPILLLDDLFSELDNKKINSLINNFKRNYQIIITTTDIDKVNQKLLKNCRVFKITNKRIEVKNYE